MTKVLENLLIDNPATAASPRLYALDFAMQTLIDWARESLPSAEVYCVQDPDDCASGACLSCRTKRVLAEIDAAERSAV